MPAASREREVQLRSRRRPPAPQLRLRLQLTKGSLRCRRPSHPGIRVPAAWEGEGRRGKGRSRRGEQWEPRPCPGLWAGGPALGGRGGPVAVAAVAGRKMVQKESQAALEERENELNANPASSAGASLEPPAAPAPGEDSPAGAGGVAVSGAAGGARKFLCGVVEGERSGAGRAGASPRPPPRPGTHRFCPRGGGGRRCRGAQDPGFGIGPC